MHKIHSRRTQLFNLWNQPDIIRAIVCNDISKVRQIIFNSNSNDWVDQNRRTPLHLASSFGRYEILRFLIESDSYTVNFRDNDLVTPLHRACRNNHLECVSLLIEYKADVNARTRNHLTPLHICASSGAFECAQKIIKHVTNIDATDSFGATALHHAVYCSQLNIVKLLLENGAKVDVQDKFGQRPIHYAAIVSDPNIIRTLVTVAGADVNVRNKYLLTPIHLAVASENLVTFTELLSFDANLEAQDIQGNNISHWASYIGYMPIFEIVSQRMKMNTPNLNGVTPLHFACSSRLSWNVVNELLERQNELHYHDLDITDKFNRTPLHYASIYGLCDVAKLLISKGSNCNACDFDLEAPIHKAVRNVHRSVIEVLNECHANVNMPNKDGFTPLHLAAMASNGQFCKILIEAGADPLQWDSCGRTAHFMAVYMGSLECFYELLSSPVYLNLIEQAEKSQSVKPLIVFPEIDGFKRSLLHYAAASKCTEQFIQILLLQSDFRQFESLDSRMILALKISFARLDLNQQDIYGRTPLHYLCRRSLETQVDITSLVRLFIDCGADNSVVDNFNRFPFHYAVANGYASILPFLIDHKWFQNQNIYSKLFYSVSCPLKIAAFYGYCSALNELLKYGFNDYETAFEIAIRRHNWSCAQSLLRMVRKKSLLLKMAYFTALYGKLHGIRLFLDLPMPILERLLFVSSLSKDGFSCVELLLFKGVNIQARDRHGRNALFYAVAGGNQSTIQLLLQCGIRFVKDHLDRNVFHLVAHKGDLETFVLLFKISKTCGYYGLLCNFLLSKDKQGFTPVEIACIKRHQSILEYYINNINSGYAEKLMLFSGICNNLAFVEYILNKNGFTFLHSRGPHDRTLMHYCCMSKLKNDFSMLKLLIDLNFDPNLPDKKGLTPLLCAAYAGNFRTIEYLFEHCPQTNPIVVDQDGNTILHLACLSGSPRTAMTLIKYAKDHNLIDHFVAAKNHSQQSALHLAAKMSLPSVIHELLRCGASVNEDDVFGYSPSLYCTPTRLTAYCLLIIETYMQPESVFNDQNSNNLTTSSENCYTEITDDGDNSIKVYPTAIKNTLLNGRTSLPARLEEHLEERMRRMSSLVCDKMSRLSLKSLASNPSNDRSRDSNGTFITYVNDNNDNNHNWVTIDSDSDTY